MQDEVYNTLSESLSSDANVRVSAELKLKQLESRDEYPLELVTIMQNASQPLALRQMAGVLLRKSVNKRWSTIAKDYTGPKLPDNIKEQIRITMLSGIADPDRKIRVTIAYVVSSIAEYDWPEEWPDLVDRLLHCAGSNDANAVHGAMRVFSELTKSDMTDEQFVEIGPILLPKLQGIFANEPKTMSWSSRTRAVTVFRNCIDVLQMMKEQHAVEINKFLGDVLPTWLQGFAEVLAIQNSDESLLPIQLEIVKTMNILLPAFPSLTKNSISATIQPAYDSLLRLQEIYVATQVLEKSDDGFPEDQDSDGDLIAPESMIYALFEFFGHLILHKSTLATLVDTHKAPTHLLSGLVGIMIQCMQITNEQADVWAEDANQFVAEEEDESFMFNVRIAARDLFYALVDKCPVAVERCLQQSIAVNIAAASNLRAENDPNWWQILEASLYAAGLAAKEITPNVQQGKAMLDLEGLFTQIVLNLVQLPDVPYAQGRAFIFASQYSSALPAEYAAQYLEAALAAVRDGQTLVVRVAAVYALQNFSCNLDKSLVGRHQDQIVRAVIGLMPTTSEQSLILCLETLLAAMQADTSLMARLEPMLGPAILDVWMAHPTDHMVALLIADMFDTLSQDPGSSQAFSQRALPLVMTRITSPPSQDESLLSWSVDLLTSLVKGAREGLPAGHVQHVFPPVIEKLLHTEDRQLLQSGQEFLRVLAQNNMAQIVECKDVHGTSGLEYIVKFVDKLLQPGENDSACAFVGELITKLIQKGAHYLTPILPDLLRAVIVRLTLATTPTLIQSLVLIFSHLIVHDADAVVNLLSHMDINSQPALVILMSAWCENHDVFHGYYAQKLSAVALCKMFVRADAMVNKVEVRGDLVVDMKSDRIITRSQAKKNPEQYTRVPVPVKIIKLLIKDLETDVEAMYAKVTLKAHADDNGDSEWEDESDDGKSPFAPAEEFQYLSDLMDSGAFDADEDATEDDPDILNDPIYKLNLNEHVARFLAECESNNVNHFPEIYREYLSESERKTVQRVVAKHVQHT